MKEVTLKLDETSIEILSHLDAIHRETFINYCIRIGKQAELYGVMTGEIDAVPEAIGSTESREVPVPEPEPTSSVSDLSIGW